MSPARLSDIDLLLPSFQARLRVALSLVRGQGYHPLLWETLRSPERVAELVAKGTGSANSLHMLGAAADVICGYHGWNCRRHGCRFYDHWGPCAEDAGLTWGGRWKKPVDSPHVQAVPVRLQEAFRALKTEAERDAFAAACMRGEDPTRG